MTDDKSIEELAERLNHVNCVHCGEAVDVSDLPLFAKIKCPHCEKTLRVPAKLGEFLLFKQLGRGGMATVYKALDSTLNRHVAIKIMRSEMATDKKFVDNFLREARAAAQINHPNIVAIYQCGKQQEQPYIVMELVSGGKLDELIEEKKHEFNEKRALKVCADAARGLNAAHETGLVHGDIKPANILFGKGGVAKVADFGLAQFAKKSKAPTGEIWGTPYYIAPEKARRKPEDHRSDMYSLGATLYHVLTGKVPFDGETAKDVVLARLKGPPPNVLDARPSLHQETAALVTRMLDPEPIRRHPNYKSLIHDIDHAIEAVSSTPGGTTQIIQRPKKKSSGLGPFIAFLVIGLLLIAGLVGLLVHQSNAKKKSAPAKASSGSGWQVPDRYEDAIAEQPSTTDEDSVGATGDEPDAQPEDVEADDPADEAVAEGEEPEPVAPVWEIQPFDEGQDAELAKILKNWASDRTLLKSGDLTQLERKLSHMATDLDADDPARIWIRLLDAMTAALQRNDKRLEAYLDYFEGRQFTSDDEDKIHPGVLPQRLAVYLAGEKPDLTPPAKLETWPDWFLDFSEFVKAVRALYDKQYDAAGRALKKYAGLKTPPSPKWPYSLKPATSSMLAGIEAWEKLKANFESWAAANDHERIVQQLKPLQYRASPLFGAMIKERLTKSETILAEREAARKAAEEAARQAKIDEEMGVLERWDDLYANRLKEKDFRSAMRALKRQEGNFETEQAQQQYAQYLEQCQSLQHLIEFLIESINASPYIPTRGEFPGKVAGANNRGLNVILGGNAGLTELQWEQVHAPQIYRLVLYYIARGDLSEQEEAEKLLCLAVFTELAGGRKPAMAPARRALKLNSDLAERLNLMAPELVTAMEEADNAQLEQQADAEKQQQQAALSARAAALAAAENITPIDTINRDMLNQTIRIRGTVAYTRDIRGGLVCVLKDESGKIELLLWQNMIPDDKSNRLSKGTQVTVEGEVQEYNKNFQLMPADAASVYIHEEEKEEEN